MMIVEEDIDTIPERLLPVHIAIEDLVTHKSEYKHADWIAEIAELYERKRMLIAEHSLRFKYSKHWRVKYRYSTCAEEEL